MGKRKHKDKNSHSRARKKRKHEKRSRRYDYDSDSSSTSSEKYSEGDRNQHYYPDPQETGSYNYMSDCDELPISDSDASLNENLRSVITPVEVPTNKPPIVEPTTVTENCPQPGPSTALVADNPVPSTSTETATLPIEILEALGDPKGKEEVFGPKIPEEIAKRWGRVLVDGLTKEQKQEIIDRSLIPDNFRLAKAPLLNPEIIPVLSEAARSRDKMMEKSQNQLGLGISRLTNLASMVIEGKMDKIEILKQISETSQIFLDLHYEDTKRRRKLVTSSLDKKFLNMITDVKRDTHLFGVNLGEKIKASKTAERSGLQIKRTEAMASSSRKYPYQGNWRGPPRAQAQRAYRQGGQRNRYWSQPSRRPPPPPPPRQPRATAKPSAKTPKTQ